MTMPLDDSPIELVLSGLMIVSTVFLTGYHIRELLEVQGTARRKSVVSVILLIGVMCGEIAGKWNEHELKSTLTSFQDRLGEVQKTLLVMGGSLQGIVEEAVKTQSKDIEQLAKATRNQLEKIIIRAHSP
jgi:hypothetical protein